MLSLSQAGLLYQVLCNLYLIESSSFLCTCSSNILLHPNVSPLLNDFKMISVLGMLSYLSLNISHKICLLNHSCARFSIHLRAQLSVDI